MDNLNKSLQLVFYLVWIPLGIILLAVSIFIIVANPFAGMMEMMNSFDKGSGLDHVGGGETETEFPSPEMMKQFMQRGEQPGFAPPNQ